MSEAGPRTRVVDDHMFEIRHPNGARRATCRLELFTAPGLRPVAVATGAPGDGCSLTNCAEKFAVEAWRCHLPNEDRPPIWIQRQTVHHALGGPGYQVVTFESDGPFQLSSPSWRGIAAEDLSELVGTHVDPDRGEGFEPPPEPIPRVRYDVRWVITLPRPQTFRAPQCMPGGGRLRRLGRQIVPRPARRDCCWYHGGDWAQVSRTAVRLVREAQANNVPDDDIEPFVIARAEANGVDGWDLEALASLVDPTDGIALERDGARFVYVNGQHRAQALLDAGVRRTLTVDYWEEMPT